MAKRFTDGDKWTKKPWFRTLKPAYKLFWIYLLDSCNQAGIWEVDFSLAAILIGEPVDEVGIREAFRKQFVEIKGGRKWFIPDFVNFQYGELRENNRMHGFILNLLKKEGVSTPLGWGVQGGKDKDKNKDKDKDKKGKERFGEEGFVLLTPEEHKKLLVKLGERKTAGYIARLENYIGSKGKRYKSHYHTILSWSQNDSTTMSCGNGSEAEKLTVLTRQQQSNIRQLEELGEL